MGAAALQGINVGDAVLTFVGDTTDLDQAYARVQVGTNQAVKPAQLAAEQLAQTWGAAGAKAKVAGDEMAGAAQKASFSMQEAKGTMALAGEEIGVKIPRHLRSFVAQLPGVGAALSAAFAFTAGMVLIEILVEAGEKVYHFIESLHQLSEEEKKAFSEYTKMLETAEERSKKVLELERQRQLVGKTELEQAKMRAQWAQGDADTLAGTLRMEERRYQAALKTKQLFDSGAMRATGKTITRNMGHGETAEVPQLVPAVSNEQMKQAEATIQILEDLYGKGLAKLKDQVSEADVEIGVKTAEQLDKSLQARIQNAAQVNAVQKDADLARIDVKRATSELEYEQGKISATRLMELNRQYDGEEHAAAVRSLEQKRQILALDPTKNAAAVRAINIQIQAENDRFRAQELQKTAATLALVRSHLPLAAGGTDGSFLQRTLIEAIIPADANERLLGFDQRLEDLGKALKDAGIQTATTWSETEAQIEEATDRMKRYGATEDEVKTAELHLLEVRRQAAEAGSEMWSDAQQKQLEKLRAEMDKLSVSTSGLYKWSANLFQLWKLGPPTSAQTWKHMTDVMKSATMQLEDVQAGAIQSWILGQDSLGNAMRKATAQVLAEYAARAAVEALYWTAYGFAMLASMQYDRASQSFTAAAMLGAFAGIAGAAAYGINPKSGSGRQGQDSGPTPPASFTAPAAAPSGPTVPHLAGGALITGRTLALLGDSRNGGSADEAVMPLTDDRAMDRIASSIASRMQGGGGVTVNVEGLISADHMDRVIDNINGRVNSGKRLVASHARRVEKK